MPTKQREMQLDIVETMNQYRFSEPLTAFALYQPKLVLKHGELDKLRCDVLPADESGARSSRGSYEHTYRFRIAFRKKINVTEEDDVEAELDKIAVVVEEVLELWKRKRPNNAHGALASFDTIQPVEPSGLKTSRIATCEIVIAFQGTRDLQE